MIDATLPPPPRVLVHVAPQLLGDLLVRVLEARQFAVSSYPPVERRGTPRAGGRYDLAIATRGLEADVDAERLVVLDEDGAPTGGASAADVAGSASDTHLARLLELIDTLLG